MLVVIKDKDQEFTVGSVDNAIVGNFVTVHLHDENGCFITAQGIVTEILEDNELS